MTYYSHHYCESRRLCSQVSLWYCYTTITALVWCYCYVLLSARFLAVGKHNQKGIQKKSFRAALLRFGDQWLRSKCMCTFAYNNLGHSSCAELVARGITAFNLGICFVFLLLRISSIILWFWLFLVFWCAVYYIVQGGISFGRFINPIIEILRGLNYNMATIYPFINLKSGLAQKSRESWSRMTTFSRISLINMSS